jgi:hypothetical protein
MQTRWHTEDLSNVGSYDWQALYQQDPRLPEGNVFKRDWMTLVEKMDVKQAVRFWDLAASSKKTKEEPHSKLVGFFTSPLGTSPIKRPSAERGKGHGRLSATATVVSGTRFINAQGATAELSTVQGFHRSLCFSICAELDKTKPFRNA